MTHPHKTEATAAAEAAARRWLEGMAAKGNEFIRNDLPPWDGNGFFDSVCLSELVVSHAAGGRVLCSFRVPPHLADEDGNWTAGSIAAAVDDIGAAAIMTAVGHIKVSVEFAVSLFSPAKINDEVEIDARLVEHMDRLSAVVVEVRKKGGGDERLVASARQWMASARPSDRRQRSSL